MNSVDLSASDDAIHQVLGSVRRKGVRLWSKSGRLHYRAPEGALTQQDVSRLRESRERLLAILESEQQNSLADEGAPLAFTQFAHWLSADLGRRRTIRQTTSATRLRGALRVSALQRALSAVVSRHEALRTRIVVHDEMPRQEVLESSECDLPVLDLTGWSEATQISEIQLLIEELILEPIDVSVGPLLGTRLLRLGAHEHVLVIATEHSICDGVSLSIILDELLLAYQQLLRGQAIALPVVSMQLADYALEQRSAHGAWIAQHGPYWNECLATGRRLRVADRADAAASIEDRHAALLPVRVDADLTAQLRAWCKLKGATLAMTVFTAYVAVVLRWCKVREGVFLYQSDGRSDHHTERLVGYLASTLYPRVELRAADTFPQLLRRVTEAYCEAYTHADAGYLETRMTRAEFLQNPAFNWLPAAPSTPPHAADGDPAHSLRCSPVRFDHPMLRYDKGDREPVLELTEGQDEITGALLVSRRRLSVSARERLVQSFLLMLRTLLQEPEVRVSCVMLTEGASSCETA